MRGSCLCGEVRFEAEPSDMHSHACHCEMCRRWTGSAFLGVAVPGDNVNFEGEPPRTYASSDWAERAFCGVCGSTLYYRVTAEGPEQGTYYIALGAFDEPGAMPLASELFIDVKPASYAFEGERKRTTKADFEAKFAGAGGA